jgi:hypothetical protein
MNYLDFTRAPEIQKPKSRIKKSSRSDIKWSNPYGGQTTHFASCIKSPNAKNSSYNHKKAGTTFDA